MWVTQLASENANNYFKRKPLLRTARQNALIGSGYRSRIKKIAARTLSKREKRANLFPCFAASESRQMV